MKTIQYKVALIEVMHESIQLIQPSSQDKFWQAKLKHFIFLSSSHFLGGVVLLFIPETLFLKREVKPYPLQIRYF